MKLKSKDFEIINLLRHGESVEKIAKKLKAPKSTIYYHVNKLKRGGMIKGLRISFEYGENGENSSAIILVSLDRTSAKEITDFANELKGYGEVVSDVYGIGGDWDFAIFAHGKKEQLESFVQKDLHKLQNIKRTSSLFIMRHLEL